MKLLNLVRERESENWSTTDLFLVEDSVDNAEEALRNAIKDYLKTKEGKISIKNSCYDFNWGDAMMDVPNEYLNKYGIYRMIDDTETIIVNQDEILFPEIQESVLNGSEINLDSIATKAIKTCKEILEEENNTYKGLSTSTLINNDILDEEIMHLFDDQAIYDLKNKIMDNKEVQSVKIPISKINDKTNEVEELEVNITFFE